MSVKHEHEDGHAADGVVVLTATGLLWQYIFCWVWLYPQRVIWLLHRPTPCCLPSSSVKQEQPEGQVTGTGVVVVTVTGLLWQYIFCWVWLYPQRVIWLLHRPTPCCLPSSSVKQEQPEGQVTGTGVVVTGFV